MSLGVFAAGAVRMIASIGAVYPAPVEAPLRALFFAALIAGIASQSVRHGRRVFGSTLVAAGILLGWILVVILDRVTLGWGHRVLEVELPFAFLSALAGAAVAAIPFRDAERRAPRA